MRLVKIGTAAVSVKVGDFEGNATRLAAAIRAARQERVHLLVTPELAISGYSLEDRIFWPHMTRNSWQMLKQLAEECDGITVFLGLPVTHRSMMYNAAALIHDKRILGLILKKYLPTYSIFYEMRNWTPWAGGVTEINGVPAGDLVFKLPFGMVSAEICEDLWSARSPARARVVAGAEIICNPSASPFTPRKNDERKRLTLGAASSLKSVYAYANVLGCDSSRLVFDGGGFVATPDQIVCEGPILSDRSWTLASGVVNLDEISRLRGENTTWRVGAAEQTEAEQVRVVAAEGSFQPAPVAEYAAKLPGSFYVPESGSREVNHRHQALDELFDALILGCRDYFEKVGAFKRFVIALSGGRDSALCLLLAVEAAKRLKEGAEAARYADRVACVYLPHEDYSSDETQQAARALAAELGVPFQVVPIQEEAALAFRKAAEMAGGEDKVTALARQNLQARIRGAMMLNWANNCGGLLLVTSNLSEAAVGYTTTGGDNEGGYSPIANVPKTLVTELLAHIARREGLAAMQAVLDIPPSAELAPDQQDEKDLMPYVVLDDLLYLYAKGRMSLADCWRVACYRHPDHSPDQMRIWTADFGRRFSFNQWKRDQHPVSLKVMDLDLDPKTGFRFPVTQSIDHELEELRNATLDD
ncbi:MAG: NAD(+) synthase [Candidatus Hydrogenedentes bacterium]|nr:NAD(+) synthase [Candidatus Hydrogenedentota bacterium]